MTQRATAIGTAGEHIVCADLILFGFLAYQTSQGLPYDIIIDNGGQLFRVAVKSTQKSAARPPREASRVCYQFAVTRSRRLRPRKRFEDYTIQRALMVHSGECEPLPFKWRATV